MLVHVDFYRHDETESVIEFQELVCAAGIQVLDLLRTKRTAPSAKYFIGSGFAEEIKMVAQRHQANVVLFNHELSPAQGRNLEQLFCCRVIDRTELILDIFAQRARSFEGKLQVELAQLEHLSTQLIRGWTHLERQKGGIGLRGPGETQLETDRRLLSVRIKTIKKRLDKVDKQRQLSRRQRQRNVVPSVSIVGYTNAGKSTLFNALTQAEIYTADQLFATLDTTLRHLVLPEVGKLILADTVGFIRHLPHDLIAAFKATLEEARQATLLLHVIDSSYVDRAELIANVEEVLMHIGAADVPKLFVFNKIDLIGESPRIDYDEAGVPQRVWVSSTSGAGLELIETALIKRLGQDIISTTVVLQPEEGAKRAQLYALGAVKSEALTEHGELELELRIAVTDYKRIFEQGG